MNEYIIEENVKMENLTSYKIKGIVKKVIYPLNEESLLNIIKELTNKKEKYKVLGFGTNIIFKDEYYNGTIIKLTKMNNLKIENDTITVDAGYSVIKLSNMAKEKSLSKIEFLSGLPGTIGGAIFGNAGAHNHTISEIIEEVKVLKNNKIIILKNKDIKFGYRTSTFKEDRNYIIISAKLKLTHGDKKEIENKMNELLTKRINSQPLNFPNAGSVFKNPENDYAGRIIENLGLKSANISDAYVSEKHANFIINKGTCTGKDIILLINKIKKKVKEELNIDLLLEQEIID